MHRNFKTGIRYRNLFTDIFQVILGGTRHTFLRRRMSFLDRRTISHIFKEQMKIIFSCREFDRGSFFVEHCFSKKQQITDIHVDKELIFRTFKHPSPILQ